VPFSQKELMEAMTHPSILGVLLAMALAVLRVIYDRQETSRIRILLESLICGGLSLTASAAITAMGLDDGWAMFAGGVIGYFGSTQVRLFSYKIINKQIDD